MARAAHTFTIAHAGIRLGVRLLPTVAAVDAEYRAGRRRRAGEMVHAYFQPSASVRSHLHGVIALPVDGDLHELVPHEVAHAVIHSLRGVSASDDEAAATAIGRLASQIFSKIRALGAHR